MQMTGHVGTAAGRWPALGQPPAWPQGCAQDKVCVCVVPPPHGCSQPRTCAKQMVLPGLPCQNHPVLAAPPRIPVAAPKLLKQPRDSPAQAHPGLPSAQSKAGLPGVSLLPIYMHSIYPYMCTIRHSVQAKEDAPSSKAGMHAKKKKKEKNHTHTHTKSHF